MMMVMVMLLVMVMAMIGGCSEEGVDWVCQGRQSTAMHSFFLLHDDDDDDDDDDDNGMNLI